MADEFIPRLPMQNATPPDADIVFGLASAASTPEGDYHRCEVIVITPDPPVTERT